MSLRKRPIITPALLAAARANARKSTGPRTPQGKARAALNALKNGSRSLAFRQKLVEAGANADVELYDWILETLLEWFRPSTRRERDRQPRLARGIWCLLRGMNHPKGIKRKNCRRGPLAFYPFRGKVRIEDNNNHRGLTFGTRRVGRPPTRPGALPRHLTPFVVYFGRPLREHITEGREHDPRRDQGIGDSGQGAPEVQQSAQQAATPGAANPLPSGAGEIFGRSTNVA